MPLAFPRARKKAVLNLVPPFHTRSQGRLPRPAITGTIIIGMLVPARLCLKDIQLNNQQIRRWIQDRLRQIQDGMAMTLYDPQLLKQVYAEDQAMDPAVLKRSVAFWGF